MIHLIVLYNKKNMALAKKKINKSVVVPVKTKAKTVVAKKPVTYRIETDMDGERADARVISSEDNIATFYIEMEGTPFCCGLRELGNFSYDTSRFIPDNEVVKAVAALLEEVLVENTGSGKRGRLLFFTLINTPTCNIVKEALKLKPDLFTCVKSFENLNSSRMNDFYVSNN